jgi:hypothetical protein
MSSTAISAGQATATRAHRVKAPASRKTGIESLVLFLTVRCMGGGVESYSSAQRRLTKCDLCHSAFCGNVPRSAIRREGPGVIGYL